MCSELHTTMQDLGATDFGSLATTSTQLHELTAGARNAPVPRSRLELSSLPLEIIFHVLHLLLVSCSADPSPTTFATEVRTLALVHPSWTSWAQLRLLRQPSIQNERQLQRLSELLDSRPGLAGVAWGSTMRLDVKDGTKLKGLGDLLERCPRLRSLSIKGGELQWKEIWGGTRAWPVSQRKRTSGALLTRRLIPADLTSIEIKNASLHVSSAIHLPSLESLTLTDVAIHLEGALAFPPLSTPSTPFSTPFHPNLLPSIIELKLGHTQLHYRPLSAPWRSNALAPLAHLLPQITHLALPHASDFLGVTSRFTSLKYLSLNSISPVHTDALNRLPRPLRRLSIAVGTQQSHSSTQDAIVAHQEILELLGQRVTSLGALERLELPDKSRLSRTGVSLTDLDAVTRLRMQIERKCDLLKVEVAYLN